MESGPLPANEISRSPVLQIYIQEDWVDMVFNRMSYKRRMFKVLSDIFHIRW